MPKTTKMTVLPPSKTGATSPIGKLILDAEVRAAKKATKAHTSTAPCGCQVSVSWFSEGGRSTKMERCTEHALDPNRKRK